MHACAERARGRQEKLHSMYTDSSVGKSRGEEDRWSFHTATHAYTTHSTGSQHCEREMGGGSVVAVVASIC